jgi:hypothetical protein
MRKIYWFKHSQGLSIVELMIALGIAGFLVGISTVQQTQLGKGVKTGEVNSNINSFYGNLTQLLSDPHSCGVTMLGHDIRGSHDDNRNPTGRPLLNSFREVRKVQAVRNLTPAEIEALPAPSPINLRYVNGGTYANGSFQIMDIRTIAKSANTPGLLTLEVDVRKLGEVLGRRDKTFQFNLSVRDLNNNNEIDTCTVNLQDVEQRAIRIAVEHACRNTDGVNTFMGDFDDDSAGANSLYLKEYVEDNGDGLPICKHLQPQFQPCPNGQYLYRFPRDLTEANDPTTPYCRGRGDADSYRAYQCGGFGRYAVGINSSGEILCMDIGKTCPAGHVVTGYDHTNGEFTCTRSTNALSASASCANGEVLVTRTIGGVRTLACRTMNCPVGRVFNGFDVNANPICTPAGLTSGGCLPNQYVVEVQANGSITCADVPAGLQDTMVPGDFILGVDAYKNFIRSDSSLATLNCTGATEALRWSFDGTNWDWECYDLSVYYNQNGTQLTRAQVDQQLLAIFRNLTGKTFNPGSQGAWDDYDPNVFYSHNWSTHPSIQSSPWRNYLVPHNRAEDAIGVANLNGYNERDISGFRYRKAATFRDQSTSRYEHPFCFISGFWAEDDFRESSYSYWSLSRSGDNWQGVFRWDKHRHMRFYTRCLNNISP